MSETRGTEGFERPDDKELEDYLKQSRKSLSMMKEGKTPLFFKPKKGASTKLIGIIILIVISSGLIIIFPMLSNQFNPSLENNGSKNQTTSSTSTLPSTSEPVSSNQDLRMAVQQLEIIIDEMIPSNLTIIHPIMINGTINTSHMISINELLDLIWYLNQFDRDSNWWNLGRELLFNEYKLWNESNLEIEELSVQLRTLRGLLAYAQEDLILDETNRFLFENTCVSLWNKVIDTFDNTSNTISSSTNSSLRFAIDQILFIEILTRAANHPTLFTQDNLQNYAIKIIETIDQLIGYPYGIPLSFYSNKSWLSPIYQFKDQGELVLSLNRLKALFDISSIDSILTRVDDFISNYFVNQDWSCSPKYNFTSMEASDEVFAQDQALLIRSHVIFERLTYAKYTVDALRNQFYAPNNGFYSSIKDQQTQYLIDQVHILLAFQELIELETEVEVSASGAWGFEILLIVFILVLAKRGLTRKRKSKKRLEK
ncbi:MAG: hypothetical protein ACFE95_02000 [Candidatus Hodarchaeota archaeon]